MAHNIPADGTLLPLMEEFYTIQGEGFNTGKAAYFIRLGGCDVGCHWCDVKESWDAELHPLTSADAIAEKADTFPGKAVVITGGEPLIYNMDYLTKKLQEKNILTFIETSGAYPLSGSWDWICLSPKKFKAPLPEVVPHANELKVVIFNKSDFAWAEQYAALVAPDCKLYLQPEWEKSIVVTPMIIDYILKNPKWEFSLQIHKYIHVP